MILLLLLVASAAQAQVPAGPHRPAGVPENFVITPFGYFHASCVQHLAEGDTFVEDGPAIQHKNGALEKVPACAYPHYTSRGEVSLEGLIPPVISYDYIELATDTTTTSYGALAATWIVPAAPASNDGQTIYLFPGFEQLIATTNILQPVLGWNSDFNSAWGVASWNCCPRGIVNESKAVIVKAGDKIQGFMRQTCAAGTLSCPTWTVETIDVTEGTKTTLANTSSDGHMFNWAFAGALEVYNVATCSDYPASDQLTFSGLALYDYNFIQISDPVWSKSITSGLNPQCGYGIEVSPTQVTLGF